MRRSQSLSGRPSMGAVRVKSEGTGRPSGGTSNGLGATGRQSTSTGRQSTSGSNLAAAGATGPRPASASRLSRGIYESGGKRSGSGFGSANQPSSKNRRASSARGFSSVEIAKDPRPISDRIFREKSIRELVEFLTQNSYPHPISMKQLVSPSAADFRRIFEFLLHFIAPTFKMTDKKMEEEVPKVLKSVGYPITISKSYMSTVGAQHTWPTILAALSWLKNLIQTSATYDKNEMLFPRYEQDFGRIPESRIVYQYSMDTYRLFMSGQDVFNEERLRLEKLLIGNSKLDEENETLERQTARNKLYLEELESDPDSIGELEDEAAHLKVDGEKMKKFLESLEKFVQNQELNLAQNEKESVAIGNELIDTTSELKRREEILSKQNESGVEVGGLSLERQSLRRRCGNVEAEVEQADRDNMESETALVNEKEKIEAYISEYNKIVQALQTTISSTVNAGGDFTDLEIRRTFDETEHSRLNYTIFPLLCQSKKQVSGHCHDLELKLQKEKDSVEQIEEMISDDQELVKSGLVNIAEMDKHLVVKKEVHHRTMESLLGQLKTKIAELDTDHEAVSGHNFKTQAEAEEALTRAKEGLKNLRMKCEEALNQRLDVFQGVLEETMKYKADVNSKLAKMRTDFCAAVDEAISKDMKERAKRNLCDELLDNSLVRQ